jgi:hypothetical protein
MTLDNSAPILTDEQKGRIYGVLSTGCDRQTAADFIGCPLTDFRSAMRNDATFAKEVRRSESGVEFQHMRNIQAIAENKKEWRASVWWLERRSPERFGRRSGAITARQLKAYIAVLADLLRESFPDPKERQPILDRLNALADDVDQILRDDQFVLNSILEEADDVPRDDAADADDDSAENALGYDISDCT